MSWVGTVASIIGLGLALGRDIVGRPSIVVKASRACDLTFVERNMGSYRQWALRIQVVPRLLQFRNGEGLQYRYIAKLTRRGKGVHEAQSTWMDAKKYVVPAGPVVIHYAPFPADWVSDQISDITLEILAVMGTAKKRLFKGNPSTLHVEREL